MTPPPGLGCPVPHRSVSGPLLLLSSTFFSTGYQRENLNTPLISNIPSQYSYHAQDKVLIFLRLSPARIHSNQFFKHKVFTPNFPVFTAFCLIFTLSFALVHFFSVLPLLAWFTFRSQLTCYFPQESFLITLTVHPTSRIDSPSHLPPPHLSLSPNRIQNCHSVQSLRWRMPDYCCNCFFMVSISTEPLSPARMRPQFSFAQLHSSVQHHGQHLVACQ